MSRCGGGLRGAVDDLEDGAVVAGRELFGLGSRLSRRARLGERFSAIARNPSSSSAETLSAVARSASRAPGGCWLSVS